VPCHATRRLTYELLRLINKDPLVYALILLGAVLAGVWRLLR